MRVADMFLWVHVMYGKLVNVSETDSKRISAFLNFLQGKYKEEENIYEREDLLENQQEDYSPELVGNE